MAARWRPARVDLPEGETFERAAATCRFKGDVTAGVQTILSKDLATATEAIFDHVHAKFGTEDVTALAAAVQDTMPIEARGMRLSTSC